MIESQHENGATKSAKTSPYEGSARSAPGNVAEKDAFITAHEKQIRERRDRSIKKRERDDTRIKLLEEQLRLATIASLPPAARSSRSRSTSLTNQNSKRRCELDEELDGDTG